jgi:hypothetical protein
MNVRVIQTCAMSNLQTAITIKEVMNVDAKRDSNLYQITRNSANVSRRFRISQ